MTERSTGREVLTIGATLLGLYVISFLAFTSSQKKAIRERDGNRCQFPADHPCNEKAELQVHHIIPQRYAKEVGIEDPDFAENGITLCEISHQNKVHPDMQEAQQTYHKNPNSFAQAFQKRDDKLKSREVYWNTTWDRLLHVLAVRNTQRAIKGGWVFPNKTERHTRN